MLEFHIDEVCPKGEFNPLIVNFQNGYPTDDFMSRECLVFEHKKNNNKAIAFEINDLLYAGDEFDESLGNILILARNRKTGKVRVIESGSVELQPVMQSEVDTTDDTKTSYVELGRKFGSKRHKKVIDQNEKLKVNEEVVKEQMQNVSMNLSQEKLDLTTYNKTDSDDFYLPPINREANNIEDVYTLESILSKEQFDKIFSEMNSTGYADGLYPFIKELYNNNWTKEQHVLALYASTLLHTYGKVMKEMGTMKFVACSCSSTLNDIILKEFFVLNKSSRSRPPNYKDKAVCHAIVFIFLINNYKIDMEEFSKHLKVVERTGYLKTAMTGAWPVKQGNKKIAVLKLPLNKVAAASGRRKSAKF